MGITVTSSASLSSSLTNLSPQVTKWLIGKGFRVTVSCAVAGSGGSSSGRAWEHWNKLGAPKLIVAPMMDQSELPFRMLWLLLAQEDRPLFVQFGANDPEMLLKAAVIVQEHCDYVDINLGYLCLLLVTSALILVSKVMNRK
jgi:hypothetical protein